MISVLVLVAIGLLISDAAAAVALRSYLIGRVDQQLAANPLPVLRSLVRGCNDQPGALPGTESYAALIGAQGQALASCRSYPASEGPPPPPMLPAGLAPTTGSSTHTVPSVGGGSPAWRLLWEPLPSGPGASTGDSLLIGTTLTGVRSTVGRLELIEGLATLAVLVGVALTARWLVALGLRPLDQMGETARSIAGGDLSQRVQRADGGSEVGRLGLALNTMLAQIESAFAARRSSEDRLRRFIADASHELRTPLTSIRGYAELFRRGARQRPQDLELAMRRIEEESIRMGVLVDDLLLLARLDQGRPLERRPVDLSLLAADSVSDALAADPERAITLQAPHPVLVLGDEARLRQVTANLLSNAHDHTPPGTAIRLATHLQDGQARLEVADEGPGLAPEDSTRVFERFYRADPSRSRARGGTGLGLSIVAAIAEAHGGQVGVETTPGHGARFWMALPAMTAGASPGRDVEVSTEKDPHPAVPGGLAVVAGPAIAAGPASEVTDVEDASALGH